MEKVCYILGAGFSAPLGLPVMTNFLARAKDLYAQEPERFEYFQDVFDLIKDMHVSLLTLSRVILRSACQRPGWRGMFPAAFIRETLTLRLSRGGEGTASIIVLAALRKPSPPDAATFVFPRPDSSLLSLRSADRGADSCLLSGLRLPSS